MAATKNQDFEKSLKSVSPAAWPAHSSKSPHAIPEPFWKPYTANSEPPPQRLTQQTLVAKLRKSKSRIAMLKKGDPSVSIDLLVRALLALGVTPNWQPDKLRSRCTHTSSDAKPRCPSGGLRNDSACKHAAACAIPSTGSAIGWQMTRLHRTWLTLDSLLLRKTTGPRFETNLMSQRGDPTGQEETPAIAIPRPTKGD